ncbi:MAG: sugar phosphate isomerase/epimerase [Nitrospirae bacterium]|nr:sugar phosphate isomerase/epimerase [Nitrospirota bacterium]
MEPCVHVCVPYDRLNQYLPLIKEKRLNLEIYFGSRRFDDITKADIIELKKILDYNPRLSIHSPFMDLSPAAIDLKIRDVTVQRFSDILSFAEILKASVVVFHSGYDKWKYDHRTDVWLEGSLETWGPLNKKAADMGVKIAIENIYEDEPENLRLLAEEMASENFGLCFDAGHFNLFSKITLTEWLDKTGRYIHELHLHDNDGTSDDHYAIGDGNIDFEAILSRLDGRNCVYTIEAHTVDNAKKSLKRLKIITDNIGKGAG